jgi:hypothetical protein
MKKRNTKARKKRERKPSRVKKANDLMADAEAQRLVGIFSLAEHLATRIYAYRCDHHSGCSCRVCDWLRETDTSPPNTKDYLIAIHAVIRSASAIYEELPASPLGRGQS